jgi:uncharacterized protein (TIGR03067 family)
MGRWFAAVAVMAFGTCGLWADDADKFQGTWRVTHAEIGKKVAAPSQLPGLKVIVDGDKFTLVEGDTEEVVHFSLDLTTKPRHVEFYAGPAKKVKKWHGIYTFEDKGKELKLCWGPAGADRPSRFTANEANENRYFVLRRR